MCVCVYVSYGMFYVSMSRRSSMPSWKIENEEKKKKKRELNMKEN